MRILYLPDPEETPKPTRSSAILKLGTNEGEKSNLGNIGSRSIREQRWRCAHRQGMDEAGRVDYSNLLRGDDGSQETSSILFVRASDDVLGQSESTAIIRGLAVPILESETDQFHNGTDPFRDYYSVVRALSVDGHGGRIDFRAAEFSASLLYYLENMFGNKFWPKLDRLSIGRGTLPHGVLIPQASGLQHWLDEEYYPARKFSKTGRPITEEYYRQLKTQGFPTGEEADIGRRFFTEYVWAALNRQEAEILTRRAATA